MIDSSSESFERTSAVWLANLVEETGALAERLLVDPTANLPDSVHV